MFRSRTAPAVATRTDSGESTYESRRSHFFVAYCKQPRIINPDGKYNTLIAIERFVEDCITFDRAGYRITRMKSGEVEFKGTPFGRSHFEQLNDYLSRFSKEVFYSHPVDLFFSVCKALNLIGHNFLAPGTRNAQGISDAELFNDLIAKIRDTGRSPSFRKRVAKDSYRAFRRFHNLVSYVDALFEHVRSRLIVIRLDLKYLVKFKSDTKVGQAQDDLKHFFSNMRNKPSLFDDLVGYIWKLEYSDRGSEHFHVILFFTNDRLLNDSHRGEQIGKYWKKTITGGRGDYFNCNRPGEKAKQKKLCIGRIEYYDETMRRNLLYPLAYFCLDEQNVREKPKQRSRMFGRGEMPQIKENPSGRPRAVMQPPGAYLVRGGIESIGNARLAPI